LKAYPEVFANPRDVEARREVRTMLEEGVFKEMTENAFRLYRTLDGIRRALKRGMEPEDITPERLLEVRRYGEHDYWYFEIDGDEVRVELPRRVVSFSLSQVQSVRLHEYPVIRGSRSYIEKAVYIEYEPWLRVMVKPYHAAFTPPMIRVFYNPLILAKRELKLEEPEGFEAQHENWVLPEHVERVVELNHRLAFNDRLLVPFIRREWWKWFCRDDALCIKVTQVELCADVEVPKIEIVSAMHVLGGRSKTVKHDLSGSYTWTDAGLKYYVTVKRGLQVKCYTKAWSERRVINRLEFTVSVNRRLELVRPGDVMAKVAEVYGELAKAMASGEKLEALKEALRPLIHCKKGNIEAHYAFWLDLLTSGQIRGTSYYRHVAEVYKRLGYIKVKGRGKYSVYAINDNMVPFFETLKAKIREILGIEFRELNLPRVQADLTLTR